MSSMKSKIENIRTYNNFLHLNAIIYFSKIIRQQIKINILLPIIQNPISRLTKVIPVSKFIFGHLVKELFI